MKREEREKELQMLAMTSDGMDVIIERYMQLYCNPLTIGPVGMSVQQMIPAILDKEFPEPQT